MLVMITAVSTLTFFLWVDRERERHRRQLAEKWIAEVLGNE